MKSPNLLQCLHYLCEHFGYQQPVSKLVEGLPVDGEYLTVDLLDRACTLANLECLCLPISALNKVRLPVLTNLKEQDDKAIIILAITGTTVTIAEPANHFNQQQLSVEQLQDRTSGSLYSITPINVSDRRSEELRPAQPKHWLRAAFEQAKPWYRDLAIASLVVNLLALVIPLFTMNVYDRVVPNQAFASLWVLAIGAAIAVIFDWLLKQARTSLTDIAGKSIDKDVSAKIFSKVMGMQLENKPQSLGAFSKQIQDFDTVREFITSATLITAIDLPFTLLFLIIIAWLGGPMVLVPIAVIVSLASLSLLLQHRMKNSLDESSRLSSHRHAQLIESLNVITEAKQNNAQGLLQRRWEQATGALADWQSQTKQLTNTLSHTLVASQQFVTVALIIFGVYRISEGLLSMGGLIAIVMLSGRAAASINQLAMLAMRYQQTKTALEGVEGIMALAQENSENRQITQPQFEGNIALKKLSFSYPEQKKSVLDNINLTINAGERIALMGPPGAGKSTLLALLSYQFRPTDGQLYYDGIESNQWPSQAIREVTGWVGQQPVLQYGSILENIAFGQNEIDKELLKQAMIQSGLILFIDQLENGLETNVGESGAAVSGGQRQTIGLARALLRQPKLLLLDEPTSSIDEKGERYVIQQLRQLPKDTTIIIATHRPSIVSMCDRVIALEKGSIIDDKALRRANVTRHPARQTAKVVNKKEVQ
ncbi:Alpha-hemolysin translocation ATP-binding protein HlyB [Sinobacterium norvegicum]|uniref:Alpha-hemolysin translocation ATP-binding protein HlyB n=1 Tax=Sinobacterium norvegicum TaxID=1641715 RepID=A0ABM9ACC8_9GAMM|nr:type I secretion system permease/ATPase [Sinobacterium norvegicum]CAH0990288.1 Alpha-hemolysin translocation ATP-binding protein HlyB [Sinobacterium norvegicum]